MSAEVWKWSENCEKRWWRSVWSLIVEERTDRRQRGNAGTREYLGCAKGSEKEKIRKSDAKQSRQKWGLTAE